MLKNLQSEIRDEKGHIMHPDGDMIAYIFATLSAQRNGNSKPAEALKTRIKEDLMRSRIDPSQYE